MTLHWFHWASWAGQLVASLLWFLSVFVDGQYESHDLLQMFAALSWLGASCAQALALRDIAMADTIAVRGALGTGPVRQPTPSPPPIGFSLVL